MERSRVVIGVDIGGTKVAAGLVEPKGQIPFKTRQPMTTSGTAREAMSAVHSVIRACIDAAGCPLQSIGVISPGPLDILRGIVVNPPNLPCWVNFPLADEIRKEYGVETHVDNDANAAGLAEAMWGAAVGFKTVFYATVGTGIGTAIVLDQKLHYGRTGMAAEGGHISIDYLGAIGCGCGKPGCVEGLASGSGIARRARQQLAVGRKSSLSDLCSGHTELLTAHEVVAAWRAGDQVATDVITETMDVLATWFGNIIDLLEPDVIVVGGGLGELVAEWFPYIHHRLPKWSINPRSQEIPMVSAKFGVDAGIVGAAALCYTGPSEVTVGP